MWKPEYFQSKVCSSSAMECVNNIRVKESCDEFCEGNIVDTDRRDTDDLEDGFTKIIEDYENYKFNLSGINNWLKKRGIKIEFCIN